MKKRFLIDCLAEFMLKICFTIILKAFIIFMLIFIFSLLFAFRNALDPKHFHFHRIYSNFSLYYVLRAPDMLQRTSKIISHLSNFASLFFFDDKCLKNMAPAYICVSVPQFNPGITLSLEHQE